MPTCLLESPGSVGRGVRMKNSNIKERVLPPSPETSGTDVMMTMMVMMLMMMMMMTMMMMISQILLHRFHIHNIVIARPDMYKTEQRTCIFAIVMRIMFTN